MSTARIATEPVKLPFAVTVGTFDSEGRSYEFDRDRIIIGRASDADLRVEHSAMSRRQFAIERIFASGGTSRFRIVPLGGRNPTYVSGQPAIEGSIKPGDLIAVGPLRISVATVKRNVAGLETRKRIALGVAALGLVAVALWAFSDDTKPSAAGGTTKIDAPLFHKLPPLACATVEACASRAHERYGKGRQYENLASADPGNWYRAAVEFAYAAQLRLASGLPLPEIADASGRLDRAASKAQQLLNDARFQYQRAAREGDSARVLQTMATIEQLVPEPTHPIRTSIDRLRRDMARSTEDGENK